MERGSTQHGPRLDEELAEAADALVHSGSLSAHGREDLDPEAPDPTEVDLTVGASEVDGPVSLDHDAVVERSELARWLRPSAFPGTAAELRAVAIEDGAPDDVVAVLERLDALARYETFGDAWAAVGGPTEPPRDAGGDAPRAPDLISPEVAAAAPVASIPAPRPAPAPTARPAPPPPLDDAPAVAGPLVTAFQIATFPVRLGVAVAREAYRIGRRIAGGG